MNELDKIISLLQLPSEAILNRTVPKSFFTREFALNPDEKRILAIPHLIENIRWDARLRLNTVNIPPFQCNSERFLEIQIFILEINREKHETYFPKIENLLFKYIPYPLILISAGATFIHVSMAKHHINQNQGQQLVIEQIYRIELPIAKLPVGWASQLLSLEKLASSHLKNLYFYYLRSFIALEVGITLEKQIKPDSLDKMIDAYNLLQKVKRGKREIRGLKSAIGKRRQINERVELGNKMHNVKADLAKYLIQLQEY